MSLKIVAYMSVIEDGVVTIYESEGDHVQSNDINRLVRFILEDYIEPSIRQRELKVTWDLDAFLAPIIKLLGVPACRQLAEKHEYQALWYIPGKVAVFTGTDGYRAFIYSLNQYFPEEDEPINVYELQIKAKGLVDTLREMGFNPYKLTSPVAIYESSILNSSDVPTALDVPDEFSDINNYALECSGKEWIEAYKVGHWYSGDIFYYDIQSCFPAIAANLYSPRYANYAFMKYIPGNADWGFMRGTVTINDDVLVSPIIHYDSDGNLSTPVGSWDTYLTLDEVRFIEHWKIGHFKVKDGWFMSFTAPVKPLEIPLQRLFELRKKNEFISYLAKRMAAGVYGKTVEQHDDGSVGKYYNPIWAAKITAKARLQVADFIYTNGLQEDLVHVGVDGCLVTKRVDIPEKTGMGFWRLEPLSSCIVCSSGRVYHGNKKPQGLTYETLVNLINRRPNNNYYTIELRRRQNLTESIEHDDLNNLGVTRKFESSLDLNMLKAESDRVFNEFPKSGRQLLSKVFTSVPRKVEDLKTE